MVGVSLLLCLGLHGEPYIQSLNGIRSRVGEEAYCEKTDTGI